MHVVCSPEWHSSIACCWLLLVDAGGEFNCFSRTRPDFRVGLAELKQKSKRVRVTLPLACSRLGFSPPAKHSGQVNKRGAAVQSHGATVFWRLHLPNPSLPAVGAGPTRATPPAQAQQRALLVLATPRHGPFLRQQPGQPLHIHPVLPAPTRAPLVCAPSHPDSRTGPQPKEATRFRPIPPRWMPKINTSLSRTASRRSEGPSPCPRAGPPPPPRAPPRHSPGRTRLCLRPRYVFEVEIL